MKRVKELVKNVLFILLVILLFKTIVSYQLAKTEYKTYEYEIKEKDTLWNIAMEICKEDDDLYVRKVINDIKEINILNSSTIYEGQVIKLPIYN